jgi:hypothetical protein
VKPLLGPCPTFVSDIDAAEDKHRLLRVREVGSSATRLTPSAARAEHPRATRYWIVKDSLRPHTPGALTLQTRMRAWVVWGRFTFHV